jgi:Ran GTPase-activating protein (RanGAP) involved in mRNA processing and transport
MYSLPPQILVLDHNQLGDLGAQALAAGLARCGTLKHLSLADCGIGAVGAAALAATMPPHPDPLIAPLVPKWVA